MIPVVKCFCKIPRVGVVASLHKSMNNLEILHDCKHHQAILHFSKEEQQLFDL